MSADLASWLLEQIAEDENEARQAVASYIAHTGDLEHPALDSAIGPGDLDAYMSVDATRVLAECEAKRRIIEEHQPDPHLHALHSACSCLDCSSLRILASVYADRPGYREEWRP